MRDTTAKHLSSLHTLLFKATRGRVGKRLVDNDMLLLTTIGCETGSAHTVPLLYLRDGDDIIVIASWGGRPKNPQWYDNLLAEPNVSIQIMGTTRRVTAKTVTGAERKRLWSRVAAAYHGYAEYQSRTDRQIPVIALRRA